jgi:hypothetical protein
VERKLRLAQGRRHHQPGAWRAGHFGAGAMPPPTPAGRPPPPEGQPLPTLARRETQCARQGQ